MPGPSLLGLGGLESGILPHLYPKLWGPREGHPLGTHWAQSRISRMRPRLPWSLTSTQVLRTCRDGFRRRQRGTSRGCGQTPSSTAPRPLPALAAAAPRFSLAAAPTWARSMLWAFAMRRLGILQQPPGGQGRKKGLPLQSLPQSLLQSLNQETGKACEIAAASMVPNVTVGAPLDPRLSGLDSQLAMEPPELSPAVALTTHGQYRVNSQDNTQGSGSRCKPAVTGSSEKAPRTTCCLGSCLFCSWHL